ncbi:GNAT family N-acetyltransferase [Kribbella sp. NPDC054772]
MIRRATPDDHDTVIAILTAAFADDPLARWLFADGSSAAELYYRPLLTHPAAEVDIATSNSGASIWLNLAAGQPPYGGPTNSTRPLDVLGEALARRHPHGQPYLYLPCMGVVPEHRGTGVGSAMLRQRLEYADVRGLGAYLEASSPRSRALYQRHGFRDRDEPVRVDGSPTLWPMWRSTTQTGDHR